MEEKYYEPTKEGFWTGRIDDEEDFDSFRWHQVIQCENLFDTKKTYKKGFAFLGFCCDQGVDRNLGRMGTRNAPKSIRKEICNLPCSFPQETNIYDFGDIVGADLSLEEMQANLSNAVYLILKKGLFPIILGGGHETAYGHFNGLRKFLNEKTSDLGIFNLDAHFDMRPYDKGSSSGTMFAQIADDCIASGLPFNYMVAGIQQYGNTVSLFKKADRLGVNYIMAKDMHSDNMFTISQEILKYTRKHKYIYMTLCSDVISAAYAPGVSAPQPFGLHPDNLLKVMKTLIQSGKLLSFDIAEVSPRFDEDNRTSKLAAIIIFSLINSLIEFDD